MNGKIKLSLGGTWLLVSVFALTLPVFLPSYPQGSGFLSNAIGTSTATMFVLSFPSSLFGLPVLFLLNALLGVDSNSIGGMYINLVTLFVLGLVQWFWIVPRVWQREPMIETLECLAPELQAAQEIDFNLFPSRDRSPVERILDENRER